MSNENPVAWCSNCAPVNGAHAPTCDRDGLRTAEDQPSRPWCSTHGEFRPCGACSDAEQAKRAPASPQPFAVGDHVLVRAVVVHALPNQPAGAAVRVRMAKAHRLVSCPEVVVPAEDVERISASASPNPITLGSIVARLRAATGPDPAQRSTFGHLAIEAADAIEAFGAPVSSNVPTEGLGSHASDLRELRIQTARANHYKAEVDRLRSDVAGWEAKVAAGLRAEGLASGSANPDEAKGLRTLIHLATSQLSAGHTYDALVTLRSAFDATPCARPAEFLTGMVEVPRSAGVSMCECNYPGETHDVDCPCYVAPAVPNASPAQPDPSDDELTEASRLIMAYPPGRDLNVDHYVMVARIVKHVRRDIYTRDELRLALDGMRVTVTDEVTEAVIANVVAYLRKERDKVGKHVSNAREQLYATGQHDAIDALVDEIADGEWRRGAQTSEGVSGAGGRAPKGEPALSLADRGSGESAVMSGPSSSLDPLQANTAVIRAARDVVEAEMRMRRETHPGTSGAKRAELSAAVSYRIDCLDKALAVGQFTRSTQEKKP